MNKSESIKYSVCTYCVTYNHALYIEDTMNGFVRQKTDFQYVVIINDDHSTDGEAEIIKKYLVANFHTPFREEETEDYNLVCARHRHNKNCIFVVYLLKYNHYSQNKDFSTYWLEWLDNSKYHAICEGDDYWINPLKLQMQYDFLESNQDYSMCCHNAIVWDMSKERVDNFNDIQEGELHSADVISRWCVPTASMMYRCELTEYPDWLAKIYSGDMALILRCLNAGRIFYYDRLMSVYRKNSSSTSLSSSMADRSLFVLEQHIELLNSFDKGTNFKYHSDIRPVVKEKAHIIGYAKSGKVKRIFKPYFYTLIARRIKRMIKA